ncbi:MAG: M15 family metallopeptidase [Treponema sp.]|nr:M15 family metallopeptidase [Treponema sp.]
MKLKIIWFLLIATCLYAPLSAKTKNKKSVQKETNIKLLEATTAENPFENTQDLVTAEESLPEKETAVEEKNDLPPSEPVNLHLFKEAYPSITFDSKYDEENQDWIIVMTIPESTGTRTSLPLYWANGSMLPENEYSKKGEYWSLLYSYDLKEALRDPATFTEEEIQYIKEYTSKEKRQSEAGEPMFFFDEIYDGSSRSSLEHHLVKTTFLGLPTNIHELIKEPLKKVEKQILEAAKNDSEIQAFIDYNSKIEGYFWRIIAGTNRKSFHSLGIAIDITPKTYQGKSVYWSWARDWNPDKWMLIPINKRWAPPKKVIDIFEENGFIWGGKWVIWDNMHFEYHPELILFSEEESKKNEITNSVND